MGWICYKLNKFSTIGKSLENFSLETVTAFYKDAKAAGYSIKSPKWFQDLYL